MDPELLKRVRTVLARASMIPEASAAGYDARSRSRDHGHVILRARGYATRDWWLERFRRARSEAQLVELVEEAEEEINGLIRGRGVERETKEEFRARIIKEHAGKHYEDAAQIERVSNAYIRRIRKERGRRPLDGHPI